MKLSICYLYPDLMNTYGDRGNIICLSQRLLWRGIDVEVVPLTVGDTLDADRFDLYFFGGGQDWQQIPVSQDLLTIKKEPLLRAVSEGAVLLSICGGFQLLARYYQPFKGDRMEGIGLFDAWTVAGKKRMIGNNVITIDQSLLLSMQETLGKSDFPTTLVGFENHSGKTYLGKECRPMGVTTFGFGNNDEDKLEGGIMGTAFGCYLHGSLLPKNPHFADYLLTLALRRRYKDLEMLSPLDDRLAYEAHRAIVERAREQTFEKTL